MKRLSTNEIRQLWFDYFHELGHEVVDSSNLVPDNDPTLLLTVAGMVPFKPYFLGQETPAYPRAVSVQKCGRTEDIDIVGRVQLDRNRTASG